MALALSRDGRIGRRRSLQRVQGLHGNRRELVPALLFQCARCAAAGDSKGGQCVRRGRLGGGPARSEEHTSELQSLMRISYAVFCLKKKRRTTHTKKHIV